MLIFSFAFHNFKRVHKILISHTNQKPIMSDDEKSVQSQTSYKLSSKSNKLCTPCRTVGLKRRSNSTPFHPNSLKKTKEISGAVKCMNFDKNVININTESKDKSIIKLNIHTNLKQKKLIEKQHEIEELRSELKNSKQHNLNQIQEVSEKWLKVCQEALISLLNQLNQNQNNNLQTMENLIKNLGIDFDLVHFDNINQEFY